MIFNKNVPLMECNLKEQLVWGLSQAHGGIAEYIIPINNLIELIAVTIPPEGCYLIVDKVEMATDCVYSIEDVYKYVSEFGWDMLWWGVVTPELINFCQEKYNAI